MRSAPQNPADKHESIKNHPLYHIFLPLYLITIGFLGIALASTIALGAYALVTWEKPKGSLVSANEDVRAVMRAKLRAYRLQNITEIATHVGESNHRYKLSLKPLQLVSELINPSQSRSPTPEVFSRNISEGESSKSSSVTTESPNPNAGVKTLLPQLGSSRSLAHLTEVVRPAHFSSTILHGPPTTASSEALFHESLVNKRVHDLKSIPAHSSTNSSNGPKIFKLSLAGSSSTLNPRSLLGHVAACHFPVNIVPAPQNSELKEPESPEHIHPQSYYQVSPIDENGQQNLQVNLEAAIDHVQHVLVHMEEPLSMLCFPAENRFSIAGRKFHRIEVLPQGANIAPEHEDLCRYEINLQGLFPQCILHCNKPLIEVNFDYTVTLPDGLDRFPIGMQSIHACQSGAVVDDNGVAHYIETLPRFPVFAEHYRNALGAKFSLKVVNKLTLPFDQLVNLNGSEEHQEHVDFVQANDRGQWTFDIALIIEGQELRLRGLPKPADFCADVQTWEQEYIGCPSPYSLTVIPVERQPLTLSKLWDFHCKVPVLPNGNWQHPISHAVDPAQTYLGLKTQQPIFNQYCQAFIHPYLDESYLDFERKCRLEGCNDPSEHGHGLESEFDDCLCEISRPMGFGCCLKCCLELDKPKENNKVSKWVDDQKQFRSGSDNSWLGDSAFADTEELNDELQQITPEPRKLSNGRLMLRTEPETVQGQYLQHGHLFLDCEGLLEFRVAPLTGQYMIIAWSIKGIKNIGTLLDNVGDVWKEFPHSINNRENGIAMVIHSRKPIRKIIIDFTIPSLRSLLFDRFGDLSREGYTQELVECLLHDHWQFWEDKLVRGFSLNAIKPVLEKVVTWNLRTNTFNSNGAVIWAEDMIAAIFNPHRPSLTKGPEEGQIRWSSENDHNMNTTRVNSPVGKTLFPDARPGLPLEASDHAFKKVDSQDLPTGNGVSLYGYQGQPRIQRQQISRFFPSVEPRTPADSPPPQQRRPPTPYFIPGLGIASASVGFPPSRQLQSIPSGFISQDPAVLTGLEQLIIP